MRCRVDARGNISALVDRVLLKLFGCVKRKAYEWYGWPEEWTIKGRRVKGKRQARTESEERALSGRHKGMKCYKFSTIFFFMYTIFFQQSPIGKAFLKRFYSCHFFG